MISILLFGIISLYTTSVTYPNGTTVKMVSKPVVYINSQEMVVILLIISIIPLILILSDYFLIYRPISEEKLEESSTPALVIGIIQLFTEGLIFGILLILAYLKINDAIHKIRYETLEQKIKTS